MFSDRVFISDHIHWYKDIEIPPLNQPLEKKWKVEIKDNCFIWINVVIHPWVTIGEHCVIWAWAVVTHDIPDFSVAVWNPAKVIKKYDKNKQQRISI